MNGMKPSDVIHRFVDEFKNGGGNMAPLDKLLDERLVHHLPAPGLPPGPAGFKAIASSVFAAFPDVHVTVELVFEQGDLVAEHSVVRATHAGSFQGLTPTGRKVTWTENNIYRVRDGRIAEMWACADFAGLMRQLQ